MPASQAEKASSKIGVIVVDGSWIFVDSVVTAKNRASIMASMHSKADTRWVRCIDSPRMPRVKAAENRKYVAVI